MSGDAGQRGAAVVGGDDADRRRTHPCERGVDGRHSEDADDAALRGLDGDASRARDAEAADRVDDDDAEREGGEGVHRVVAVEEAAGDGAVRVRALGGGGDVVRHRFHEGGDDERAEQHEESGGEVAPDPVDQLAGTQRCGRGEGEEDRGECEQRPCLCADGHRFGEADLVRDGRGARDRECRPDRQVQQAREDDGEAWVDARREFADVARARQGGGDDAEDGQARCGDEEPDRRERGVRPGFAAHLHGKDEVAGAEEQPEQHRPDEECLCRTQPRRRGRGNGRCGSRTHAGQYDKDGGPSGQGATASRAKARSWPCPARHHECERPGRKRASCRSCSTRTTLTFERRSPGGFGIAQPPGRRQLVAFVRS